MPSAKAAASRHTRRAGRDTVRGTIETSDSLLWRCNTPADREGSAVFGIPVFSVQCSVGAAAHLRSQFRSSPPLDVSLRPWRRPARPFLDPGERSVCAQRRRGCTVIRHWPTAPVAFVRPCLPEVSSGEAHDRSQSQRHHHEVSCGLCERDRPAQGVSHRTLRPGRGERQARACTDKTGNNSHNERSSDIIIFKGIAEAPAGKGPTFDALGDAENMATPTWSSTRNPATGATGFGDLRNWRAPVDPVQFESDADPQPEPVDHEALLRDVRDTLMATLAKIDSALRI